MNPVARNLMIASLSLAAVATTSTAHAAFISADSASASSYFRNGPGSVNMVPTHLINGQGLDNLANGAAAIHNGTLGASEATRGFWHAGVATAGGSTGLGANEATVSAQYVDFTFNAAVDLTNIYIWQYSQANQSANGRGVQDFNLWVSTTTDPLDFVQVGSTLTLANSSYDGSEDAQTFDLVASGVRMVRIDIVSDYDLTDDLNYVGLSEVHFETVPEPGSLALMGLGAFAAFRRRR